MKAGLIKPQKQETHSPFEAPDMNDSRRKWRYYWDLITTLIRRDVQLRYRRSTLGIIWSMINPLLMLVILTFVFQKVVPLNIPNYPAYVFCGLIAWNWFSACITASNNTILGNADLVRKPYFATETLVLISVGSNMVNYLLTLPILFGLMVLDGIPLSWSVLFLPLIIALQFILAAGLGMLISALNVYFRDTEHLSTVLLLLWFYITPIFYKSEGVPSEYAWIFEVNPMAQILQSYRQITLGGSLPDAGRLGWAAFLAIAVGLLGFFIFHSVKHSFVEEL